jgi:signal transduction histidine kinase
LPRSILILDQSTPGLGAYTRLVDALRLTINAESSHATSIYAEQLDLTHFNGPEYERALGRYLHDKYLHTPIGLIVVIGTSALEFALKSRASQWTTIPVVFCLVDERAANRLRLPPDVTGQTIGTSLMNSINAARALVPDLSYVALVGDALERQPFRREYALELPQVASTLPLVNLLGLPFAEVQRRVAELPAKGAIVYTALTIDQDGAVHTPTRALETIAAAANRPIVADVETYLDHGAVGGFVLRPAVVGREAARLALRVLDGESVSGLPVTPLPDAIRPIFDWRQLQRWGIGESQLPPGSEVRFRELNVWDQHKVLIIAAVTALLLQTALIAALLYEDRRRKLAESEARQRLSESAHLNRVITAGALSASLAHQIRQPLSAIVAYGNAGLRWLTNKTPDYEEARISLSRIVAEGHRAAEIIEHLRALFKKDDGNRSALDINSVIHDALALTSDQTKKHHVAIKLSLCADPAPLVLGDRIQLEQVLLNLIMNAIEAMSQTNGSRNALAITTKVEHIGRVTVTVEDSGPGFNADELDQLFKPYFTTKPGGMGLGLSICRSIVESHSGQITATGTNHHGIAFHIDLPLHKSRGPL